MRIIFTGGGTGGHIYPALALARYIRKVNPRAEIIFVGAQKGMEEKIVPAAGFRLLTLPVKGLPRRLNLHFWGTFYFLGKSGYRAGKILSAFKPDLIVGTGGYAAAPVILAAFMQRKKVLIHEQNVIPGVTNRLVAPYVYKVCLSFEASRRYFRKQNNLRVTGNPRASEVGHVSKKTALQMLNMQPSLPLLLVVGGSRGAERINRYTMEFLLRSTGHKGMQILYITGEIYYDEVVSRLRAAEIFRLYGGRLQVRPYQQEMSLALAAADLMITRAGATTLAEITALGVPAIVVPSPNVVHNHQVINARELSRQGAAVVIEEQNLNAQLLQEKIFALLNNPGKLNQMKDNSKRLGYPQAAENIYKLMFT
ncbi:MAG: undecaprenyldiphospho-muramoylpentapeptide beta-N-acetylglucosaminyltransferase [Firmicutes bacterium]|nr:undecaprenyldiphospho-muramoylpentapeptide beta-N-acetylglucosaminyltransferase [Bacillota bacterium]